MHMHRTRAGPAIKILSKVGHTSSISDYEHIYMIYCTVYCTHLLAQTVSEITLQHTLAPESRDGAHQDDGGEGEHAMVT